MIVNKGVCALEMMKMEERRIQLHQLIALAILFSLLLIVIIFIKIGT